MKFVIINIGNLGILSSVDLQLWFSVLNIILSFLLK